MALPLDLDAAECRRLLDTGVVGRVAVTTPDGPHIVPVNYAVVDDRVVVRTTPYSLLGTYGRGTRVAFEVDHVNHEQHVGWSVLVRGRADVLDEAGQLARVRQVWPRPWADGHRALLLGLPVTEISGRRLGRGWDLEADLDARRVLPTR